jgi:hypothetical protein
MNRRHKAVLALSLAVAGLALLNGAKTSEALGILLIGASLAWLIGSQFVLTGAKYVWRHRIWTAIIIIVGAGAVYGWTRYHAYKIEKREAAYQAKMKPIWDCLSRNSRFTNADAECEKDPSVTLQELPVPAGLSDEPPLPEGATRTPPSLAAKAPKHVKALSETTLTTTEYGSLTCGHIRAGETAVLLVDGGLQVKIKTAGGQVGWAFSSNFEMVGGK